MSRSIDGYRMVVWSVAREAQEDLYNVHCNINAWEIGLCFDNLKKKVFPYISNITFNDRLDFWTMSTVTSQTLIIIIVFVSCTHASCAKRVTCVTYFFEVECVDVMRPSNWTLFTTTANLAEMTFFVRDSTCQNALRWQICSQTNCYRGMFILKVFKYLIISFLKSCSYSLIEN